MLYLVRHGETEWNAAGRWQGQGDSPLTARGRDQASRVGRALARDVAAGGAPFPAVASPLGRTRETAALIAAELPLAITFDDRLREIAFGAWEGRFRRDIELELGVDRKRAPRDWIFRSPGGETLDMLVARVESWLAEAQAPLVVISHGMTGRVIRSLYAGLPLGDLLSLPVPQDGYFRLDGGRIDYVEA